MKRQVLVHTAPERVIIVEEECPIPGEGEVLVATRLSGISSGTEGMIFRGLFPEEMPLDASLPAMGGEFRYPFRYGYCCVGEVIECGAEVPTEWLGKRVFAFNPHMSRFTTRVEELIELPDGVCDEDAIFLANMETAVNLVQDGKPVLGEEVILIGLGVVGLLTCALLVQFPLSFLGGLDLYPMRRQIALRLGASVTFNPQEWKSSAELREAFHAAGLSARGADLVYELSGSPSALNEAVHLCGFDSRIVIGSWYGKKSSPLDLGGSFHRNRIRITSSQVSTLAPELTGRWDKQRRLWNVISQLERIKPGNWITHRFPISEGESAFRLLVDAPERITQIVFTYPA